MKKYLFTLLASGFLFSCQSVNTDKKAELETIMQTDRQFSDLSAEKGMKTAFLQYIDSGGILLRENQYPIVGKDANRFLTAMNDSGFTLTWEPQAGEVSASGDMGFTYGIYTLTTKDTTAKGTYVSIWKKQPDGHWKFILDTGNTGLGDK